MEGAGRGRNDVEDQGNYYDQRVCVIEAVRDDDDTSLLSRLDWVLFMTIKHCIFDIHSEERMYFMTRVQYLLANIDTREGISICRHYQSDLELQLHNGLANKARYDSSLDFV